MENVFGLLGLALVVFAVAVFAAAPGLGSAGPPGARTRRRRERRVSRHLLVLRDRLFGAAMTPYEVFFFSSGAVEEKWTVEGPRRSPGPTCSSASRSAGCCRCRSRPAPRSCCCPTGIAVDTLVQVGAAGGARRSARSGSASRSSGFVAATFGAALETALSSGYTLAQFFGWPWGKFRAPRRGAALPPRDDRLIAARGARRRC